MEDNAREMILQADGITCSSCAGDMESILQDTEGILSASVNFADEKVSITYNSRILDRKQAFAAVRKLGYKLKIIKETQIS